MPPRRTPMESFFDRIADRVLDQLDEILEPHLDGIAKIVTQTVEQQVRRGGGQASGSRPQPPPRQERAKRTRGVVVCTLCGAPARDCRCRAGQQSPPPPPTPRRREPTLYDDLQLHPQADPETVKAAFRALSMKYHPDNQTTGNTEKARRVIEAYEVLGDAGRRKAYDRTLPR